MPVIETIKKALHLDSPSSTTTPSTTTPAPAASTPAATSSTTSAPVAADPAIVSVATTTAAPAFDSKDVTVLFVLGGPGVGQCTCPR